SLDASTVTPGIGAPDVSFTVPLIALCALATAGTSDSAAPTTRAARILRAISPPIQGTACSGGCRTARRTTTTERNNTKKARAHRLDEGSQVRRNLPPASARLAAAVYGVNRK